VVAAAGFMQRTEPVSGADVSSAIEKFLEQPSAASSYDAHRRLEATGYGRSGWIEVQTRFTAATGLRYEVTGEGGSGYIRSRVLRSLLEEERRTVASGGAANAAITRANYRFAAMGLDPNGLIRVALQPLRNERALLAGAMFLTRDEGTLVRVEGRPAKTPSWWVSRVDVIREYRKLNGAVAPISMEATAQLRTRGSATLRMTYRYSQVNEKPVRVRH
jgi:hypothetical protein